MLYIILLLILAALLFGSSAVIGFLGAILGFIAAGVALVWASIVLDLDPIAIWFIGFGALIALFIFGAYCNHRAKHQSSSLTGEEREIYERMLRKNRGTQKHPTV